MRKPIRKLTSKIVQKSVEWARKNKTINSALYTKTNENIFTDIRQHEWMLSCNVRVDTYHDAIQKHVKEGDVVADLGTGTGVLSFFASKKKPKKIYAIDHGEIINLAKHISKQNGIENIEFVSCHSSEFSPSEKVDVIIQEQIGDFLLDEDMIRNVCDLRDRVLAPGGKILPSKFELYVEPVSLLHDKRIDFVWERKLHGIDFTGTEEFLKTNQKKYNFEPIVFLHPYEVSHFLGDPESIYSFDLMDINPDKVQKRFSMRRKVVNPGMFDGFCIYFNTIFDDEISFKTGPFDPLTSWFFQLYRVEKRYCEEGDIIEIDFEMPDENDVSTWKIKHQIISDKK